MDQDPPGWAARLTGERERRGWSKHEMARQLHTAIGEEYPPVESLVRQVRRWERGEHLPDELRQGAYATAFGLSVEELFPVERAGVVRAADFTEQVRHDLIDALTVGALSNDVLDDWERIVLRHGQATRERPAVLLLADLTGDLAELQRVLVRSGSASTLRRLARVVAQMAGLVCLTLIKLDNRQAFRGWARTARTAAREAGDPLTCAWVLAQEAYGHFYAEDMTEAVTVARQAQAATQTPCVGAVLAAALEARAHAVRHDAPAARAALDRAESGLGRLDSSCTIPSAFGYDEAQLRFHEGNALTRLGHTAAARTAQDRALALYPVSDFMDRALTRLDRASCIAQDGDPASAVAYAIDVLSGLSDQRRAGIITTRGHEIMDALPRTQRALPATRELQDLLMLTADDRTAR